MEPRRIKKVTKTKIDFKDTPTKGACYDTLKSFDKARARAFKVTKKWHETHDKKRKQFGKKLSPQLGSFR